MNSRQRRKAQALEHQRKREEQEEAIRQYKLKRRQPKTKEELQNLAIFQSMTALALTYSHDIRRLIK